jgi:hypothetical protein
LDVLPGEASRFSLVQGGPTFRLLRWSHLSGGGLELLKRRSLVICAVAWLPLLVLSLLEGHAFGGGVRLPFLHDLEAHVRLLIALPTLIVAEYVVHRLLPPVVGSFTERGLVREGDLPRFHAALGSAIRLRNSPAAEIVLYLLALTVGQWLWRTQVAADTSSWYSLVRDGRAQLTAAGGWYAIVSIPLFQFVLLRWYFRFFVWYRFLWHVSRLDLRLIATHPDRAGGLAFVGRSTYFFGPVLFAQGALLAGLIEGRLLRGDAAQAALSIKVEIATFIAVFLVLLLGPLAMFTLRLMRCKREGLAAYGALASTYVEAFDQKWIRRHGAEPDELLGSGDIQSLADLGNSYSIVKEMHVFPFGWGELAVLAGITAAPLVPLIFNVLSPDELISQFAKVFF